MRTLAQLTSLLIMDARIGSTACVTRKGARLIVESAHEATHAAVERLADNEFLVVHYGNVTEITAAPRPDFDTRDREG